MNIKNQIEIKIEKFSEKGIAIAYDENKNKIIIPKAIIEDVVLVELNKKIKSQIKGNILKLLIPSKYRCQVKCMHFDICGGCIWQNLKYKEQLKQKEKLVIHHFEEFFKKENTYFFPIEPCENIFEYRNRLTA